MLADLNKKIAIGYLWNLLAKWLNRSVGLICTLLLVRILEPADFGIVALASIVMAFFVMLSNAGTDKYLIKAKLCSDEMLDSAWSLNITLKLVCSMTLAMLAKQLAVYMNEPALVDVLLVSCLIPVLSAFKNVGLVRFERELNYKPLTQLSVTVKIAVVPVTLALALYLKNYWALVIGLIASEVMTVIGSYMIHPYRPKWSIKLWHQQWSFSKWHLLSMTSGYLRSRIDAILLGRYLTSSDVGIYRVSQEFAWLPFTELIAPATSSMYSGLTQVREDREQLSNSILRYLAISYLLVVPSVLGIFALSDLFTNVVLGHKWAEASPIIGMLAILMLSMPLNISLQAVLTSLSKIKYLILLDIIMIAAVVSIIIWLSRSGSFELLVYTEYRVLLVGLFIILLCLSYKALVGMSVLRLMLVVLAPMLPAMVMVHVVTIIEGLLDYPDVINLMILILVGILVYAPLMLVVIFSSKQWLDEYAFILNVLKKMRPSVQNG
ncbi:oligosaccharide flippase family protein [Vibrio sp. PID23_8]|uniref:oligosaccharide flippase family protein n=1 Tax=Vibrio sp. PID23_8 TaxID=1583767 RepID=UPI000E6A2F1F|nr:oligosaccharide flippase family protein [Vibrio sp. PID23_8]RIZ50327.1 hypothetical protein AK966_18705 [Vibrio sp. PID23_8]